MPFRSKAQQRFMFKNHPEIAKRWAHEYGVPQGLPARKTSMRDVLTKRSRMKKMKKR